VLEKHYADFVTQGIKEEITMLSRHGLEAPAFTVFILS